MAFIRSMILPRGGVRTRNKTPSWSSQVWEIYERVTGQPRPEMFESTREVRVERNDQPPV